MPYCQECPNRGRASTPTYVDNRLVKCAKCRTDGYVETPEEKAERELKTARRRANKQKNPYKPTCSHCPDHGRGDKPNPVRAKSYVCKDCRDDGAVESEAEARCREERDVRCSSCPSNGRHGDDRQRVLFKGANCKVCCDAGAERTAANDRTTAIQRDWNACKTCPSYGRTGSMATSVGKPGLICKKCEKDGEEITEEARLLRESTHNYCETCPSHGRSGESRNIVSRKGLACGDCVTGGSMGDATAHEKNAADRAKYRNALAERRADGKCYANKYCNRPLTTSTWCADHAAAAAQNNRILIEGRRAQGTCIKCTSPLFIGSTSFCEVHFQSAHDSHDRRSIEAAVQQVKVPLASQIIAKAQSIGFIVAANISTAAFDFDKAVYIDTENSKPGDSSAANTYEITYAAYGSDIHTITAGSKAGVSAAESAGLAKTILAYMKKHNLDTIAYWANSHIDEHRMLNIFATLPPNYDVPAIKYFDLLSKLAFPIVDRKDTDLQYTDTGKVFCPSMSTAIVGELLAATKDAVADATVLDKHILYPIVNPDEKKSSMDVKRMMNFTSVLRWTFDNHKAVATSRVRFSPVRKSLKQSTLGSLLAGPINTLNTVSEKRLCSEVPSSSKRL